MTIAELERKMAGKLCMRLSCSAPCCDDSGLCQQHRIANAQSVARRLRHVRPRRRALRLCADCTRPSETYRCKGGCEAAQLDWLVEVEIITART